MKNSIVNEFLFARDTRECIGFKISKPNGKAILCKPVYKRRLKKTPRQQQAQDRFTEATQYAKQVMQDPARKQAYAEKGGKTTGNLYTAIVTDYLRNGER